ncbi:alpha/beta-hydrolase [Trametes maxima]|nr:alpha/beta-hydrolase [Trametes maxima]
MDATLYKDLKVSRGLTYHYFYSPAAPGKPTLLLVHGFPSTSFDWHRQVEYLRPKGYGLVVPDLIGAGETSKPEDPDAFRFALIARDIVDILDAEGLDKVVGIAHDWGSVALSRLANLFQERFYAFAWVAVSYNPPRHEAVDVDAMIKHLQTHTGDGRFGYWKFFNEEDAHIKCEENIDSFLHLVYPVSHTIWSDHLTPVGKAKVFVGENRTPGRPAWLTQQEYDHNRTSLLKGGLKSYLNYYKSAVRSLNLEDDKKIPEEEWTIRKPALFVGAKYDAVGPSSLGKLPMQKYVPHAKIVELDVGHWVQLEGADQLNAELESWIEGLGLPGVQPSL